MIRGKGGRRRDIDDVVWRWEHDKQISIEIEVFVSWRAASATAKPVVSHRMSEEMRSLRMWACADHMVTAHPSKKDERNKRYVCFVFELRWGSSWGESTQVVRFCFETVGIDIEKYVGSGERKKTSMGEWGEKGGCGAGVEVTERRTCCTESEGCFGWWMTRKCTSKWTIFNWN